MSGETCRPKNSQSSPTFETMVTSEKGWTARRPWRKRAAPTPPARTVSTAPTLPTPAREQLSNGATAAPCGGSDAPMPRCSLGLGPGSRSGALRLPELTGEGDLADVLPQVLHGVEERPGGEELDIAGGVPVATESAPVHLAGLIDESEALLEHPVDQGEQFAGVAGGVVELRRAVAGRG